MDNLRIGVTLSYERSCRKRKKGGNMKLAELFPSGGKGVIATASADGVVNTAIYARPHIIDDETLAWGMTDSRSYGNLMENPHASYLYMAPVSGFSGWRLKLELTRIEDGGDLLEKIKASTREIVSAEAAAMVKHVGYFKVTEVRPLI
jgi:hypothetical protein